MSLLNTSAQAAPNIQAQPSAVLQRDSEAQTGVQTAPANSGVIIERRSIYAPSAPANPAAANPFAIGSTNEPRSSTTEAHAEQTTRSERPRRRIQHTPPADALNIALQHADSAFSQQDYAQVITLLSPHENALFKQRNQGAARLLGWAAFHRADWPLARLWFTRAANWSNQAEDIANLARVELADGQLDAAEKRLAQLPPDAAWRPLRAQLLRTQAQQAFAAQDYPRVSELLAQAAKLEPLDAGGLEVQGWSAYKQGDNTQAARFFAASYRQQASLGAAQGLVLSHHALGDLRALYALQSSLQEPQDAPLSQLLGNEQARQRVLDAAEGQVPRVSLNAELHIIPSIHTPAPQPNIASVRAFSQDNSIGTQSDARFRQHGVALQGQLAYERDFFWLQSRLFNADDDQQRQNGLYDLDARWRHENSDGLESTLALGFSPAGGILSPSLTGEIGLGRMEAEQGGRISLVRSNVQQSILSMSGARLATPEGEITWGQVMSHALKLSGYQAFGHWKGEGSLQIAALNGQGVADNQMGELYANLLHPLDQHWQVGPELYVTSYAKNLSQFTPGHGGYYSPEYLVRLGALLRYSYKEENAPQGRSQGWNIRAQAGAGWQQAREAAADFNPLTGQSAGYYAANTSRGLTGSAELELSYQTVQRWRFSLLLSAQESPSYSMFQGWLSLSYLW